MQSVLWNHHDFAISWRFLVICVVSIQEICIAIWDIKKWASKFFQFKWTCGDVRQSYKQLALFSLISVGNQFFTHKNINRYCNYHFRSHLFLKYCYKWFKYVNTVCTSPWTNSYWIWIWSMIMYSRLYLKWQKK